LLSAANGNLGVKLARDNQPAVILMDINLPGTSTRPPELSAWQHRALVKVAASQIGPELVFGGGASTRSILSGDEPDGADSRSSPCKT
jgi:hypothetical protein